jgi:AAA domain (dynein-related subfamily)
MDKREFEDAVKAALSAASHSGTKWATLERAYGDERARGSGALSNSPAERRTRVRQLLTTRRHPGFPDEGYSRYGVYVLGQDHAEKDRTDPDYITRYLVRDLRAERPDQPPADCLESVLVLRNEPDNTLTPRLLVRWGRSYVTDRYHDWYPGIEVVDLPVERAASGSDDASGEAPDHHDSAEESPAADQGGSALVGKNVIFFGPPGCGKSHAADGLTQDFQRTIRTVFHSETSNYDFVGTYAPVCGSVPGDRIRDVSGTREIDKPVVYYEFRPGPLIQAIVAAVESAPEPVALVIEEINRGDCAAIFGEFFQLLDRSDSGASQYGIQVNSSLGTYLVEHSVVAQADEELVLPSNLWIVATMNTSDQGLFAMDAAFKRRWQWKAVPVMAGADKLSHVKTGTRPDAPRWVPFVQALNRLIVDLTHNEDKQIGLWYIKASNGVIADRDLREKLLFYLWHDVLRGRTDLLFDPSIRTFDNLQCEFDSRGIVGICAIPLDITEGSNAQATPESEGQPLDAGAGPSPGIEQVADPESLV